MLNCEQMESLMDEYLSDELDEPVKSGFEQHLNQCPHCKALLADLDAIQGLLQSMPMAELPKNFEAELHQRLLEITSESGEAKTDVQPAKAKPFVTWFNRLNTKRTWQWSTMAAAASLILVLGSGQLKLGPLDGMSTRESTVESAVTEGVTFDAAVPAAPGEMVNATFQLKTGDQATALNTAPNPAPEAKAEGASVQERTPLTANRQIVYNGNLSMEVLSQKTFVDQIKSLLNSQQGYIENSSFGQMSYESPESVSRVRLQGSLVLRVPVNQFEGAYETIKSYGKVISESQYATDVTQYINDTESQIKNLSAREASLRQLMSKAVKITEIMEVDRELASVRSQIDSLTMGLNQQKQAVAFSTITIHVIEVPQLGSLTDNLDGGLFERAWKAFASNVNWMLYYAQEAIVWIFAWSPAWLLIIAAAGIIVYRRRKRT